MDDDVDPFTSGGCFEQEVARVVRRASIVHDALESWVAPVGHEGSAGNEPSVDVARVGDVDVGVISKVGAGSIAGDDWRVQRRILVTTFGSVVVRGGSRGSRSSRVLEDGLDVGGLSDACAGILVV